MRVAVNTRFLLKDHLEGVGGYTHEVCRRLVKRYPQHEFFFLFDRPYSPEFIYSDNVQPLVLFPQARHPWLWKWYFEYSIPRIFKKYQPDVFFSPDGFVSLRSKVRTVIVMHDLAYTHYPEQVSRATYTYYKKYVPKFVRRADAIIAVSEFTKQDIVQQFHIPPDKIHVGYNDCKPEFCPLTEVQKTDIKKEHTGGKEYFFYAGSIHPRKNVARLIRAFDLFKSTSGAPIQLLIAGRKWWQTDAVDNAYEEAQHKKDICFLGYVPNAEMARLMGASMALVYPSLFEGFGVPVLEAMHCEVPIITSDVSSLPEVAGDAALLVNPTSVDSIADAMQQLYRDSTLREKLVRNGQQQRQQFNWEKTVDLVGALLFRERNRK